MNNCKECKYVSFEGQDMLVCRRYPPRMECVVISNAISGNSEIKSVFTPIIVSGTGYCGEYCTDKEIKLVK